MPIQTNLNIYPYYDDHDPAKNYYRVLFKPGVSVQTRELNSLQTILQEQIERFGDNVIERGTIVSGCNFLFHKPYPYIKLPDTQVDGALVTMDNYVGKFVLDETSGLKAYIVNKVDGYELSDPNLKTVYLTYVNSGDSGNTIAFVPGNTVIIYDGTYPVSSVEVINGGSGFSNTDQLVVSSSVLVNVATGTFSNGDYLVNPVTGANSEIIFVDTTSTAGKTLLSLKPRNQDLINTSANVTAWTFSLYDVVTNPSGSAAGTIEQIYGEDVQGKVVTNSTGTVREIVLLNQGKNFTELPTVVIRTANSLASVDTLDLSAKTFLSKVRIPTGATSVGNGYAFGVSEGITYQNGYFLRVAPQTVVVSKYSSSPNNVSVGFHTVEEVVTAQEDDTLYENALGTPNEFAPGADRLKLTPTLILLSKEQAAANANFFTLCEWNDGNPYKKNPTTSYSRIGDAMASLIYDSSGNFVLDAFQVTTEAVSWAPNEGTHYTAVVDPGQAFINGKKVQTSSNYKVDMIKGTDTKIANNTISLNYGNYIRVQELAGEFDFSGGDTIDLYDRPVAYVSNSIMLSAGTINPQGSKIGTARIRSMELESGYPGTATAVYRLYLFDINMLSGQNFRNTKAVYYDGAYEGIADVILTFNASTSSNIAQMFDTGLNSLLFPAGVESLKNSNNTTYTYRTIDTVNTDIDAATITITLNDVNEFFPYEGDLALSEMQEVTVIPVHGNIECTNAVGTVAVNTTSAIVTGTGTAFTDNYAVGDYIMVTNYSTNINTRRVVAVGNSTSLQVSSPFSFTTSGLYNKRIFPKNLPIPFGQRQGLYANVDVSEQVLTLQFRHSNSFLMDLAYSQAYLETKVAYNVERRGVNAATKLSNRNQYVKISLANNSGGTAGPWCIGVPDAFRLRAVYVGNSSVNVASTDITSHFYLDHNQNANYMGLGYLYLKPRATVVLSSNQYLLMCFDYFTRDNAGYYDTVSYLRTANTAEIAAVEGQLFDAMSHNDAAMSWEVPEVYTYDNKYFDLLNTFDFRPTAANTVSPTDNPVTAPINPSDTVILSTHSKFPRPDAVMKTQVEHYLGRIDDIYIAAETGSIYILKGMPDVNPRNRYNSNHPKDTLRLQTLIVPPYPNLCKTINRNLRNILTTGMGNEKSLNLRLKTHTIDAMLSTHNQQTSQPMVYTMEDIANLERRIKDLEYYVALSVLETNLTNKIIPSSLDPSLDRFKFGFFADDFSTPNFCDLNNPQYNASIELEGSDDIAFGTSANPFSLNPSAGDQSNVIGTDINQPSKIILRPTNRLVPPKRVWSLKHFVYNPYYVDEEIIQQLNATTKMLTPNVPLNPCVVQLGSNQLGNAYYTSINRNQSTVYFENLSGFVTVYFDVLAGAAGRGGKFTIYNANNVVLASTDAARNSQKQLTAADTAFLSTSSLSQGFYTGVTTSNLARTFTRSTVVADQDYGIGVGKIQIPAQGGGKIIIKAEPASPIEVVPNVKYLVEFPSMVASNRVIVNTPECDPNPAIYRVGLESGALTRVEWSCSNIFRTESQSYRAFVVLAAALKPSTVHQFYLDSKVFTNVALLSAGDNNQASFRLKSVTGNIGWAVGTVLGAVAQEHGVTTGSILKTDKSGKIAFLVNFPLATAGWFAQDFNVPGYILDNDDDNVPSTDPATLITLAKKQATYGSSGYTTLVLQDASGTSVAGRVFANRTPVKTIADDPRGAI